MPALDRRTTSSFFVDESDDDELDRDDDMMMFEMDDDDDDDDDMNHRFRPENPLLKHSLFSERDSADEDYHVNNNSNNNGNNSSSNSSNINKNNNSAVDDTVSIGLKRNRSFCDEFEAHHTNYDDGSSSLESRDGSAFAFLIPIQPIKCSMIRSKIRIMQLSLE
jgi:hypothetical protein